MEKRLFFYSFILGLSLLIIGVVSACTCAPLPSPQEALETAAMVFSGKVIEIIPPDPKDTSSISDITAIFEISHIWKGSTETNEISILTPSSGISCGISFREGGEYLVYALHPRNGFFSGNALLWTNFCTRTENLSWAQEDLEAFGAGTILKEQVKCVFVNSTSSKKCYTDNVKFGCSGVGACVAEVSEEKAKLLTWKSSCGEKNVYTIIDGIGNTIKFECVPTLEKNITDVPIVTGRIDEVIESGSFPEKKTDEVIESGSFPERNITDTLIKRIFTWFKEFFRVG